jgi:2-polyprenyl-3-methyl-5-hydroxy-6-metoxy-1,4-benzoquinol methylase
MRTCWCGNTDFLPFGPEYRECQACETLVSKRGLSDEKLVVRNDETDFYGKGYWFDHQQQELGFPDIEARARNDLPERNLHWLKALLKYCLPPANVLEIGCSSGSFVALMRHAGYEASGVEMSPWVVAFGKKTFDVPIRIGPVESLDFPLSSFDVIALMDVLEHLPDPEATMRYCLRLLKPDGLLLIQAPQFKKGMSYNALVESHSQFLAQLKSEEHLYLFSERSVKELFRRLGAECICFEPAIFAQYDMFLAVSRMLLQVNTTQQIESALLKTSTGRIVLALLDMDENTKGNKSHINELITFRDNAISQVQTLTGLAKEAQELAEELQKDMNDQTVAHAKELGALQAILSLPVMRFARRISDIHNRFAKKFTGGDGV